MNNKDIIESPITMLLLVVLIICFFGGINKKNLEEKCGQYEDTPISEIPAECFEMYGK